MQCFWGGIRKSGVGSAAVGSRESATVLTSREMIHKDILLLNGDVTRNGIGSMYARVYTLSAPFTAKKGANTGKMGWFEANGSDVYESTSGSSDFDYTVRGGYRQREIPR